MGNFLEVIPQFFSLLFQDFPWHLFLFKKDNIINIENGRENFLFSNMGFSNLKSSAAGIPFLLSV